MAELNATLISIPAAAYLLGSIPFGLSMGKLFGAADIRKAGSGNIGATNVARVAGPFAGILTLLLDAAKGAFAVILAARLSDQSSTWTMIAGLCALLGHCFPIWLGFHGGKGVATGLGAFLFLAPKAVLIAAVIFIAVAVSSRYVSLGSIVAVAAFPFLAWLIGQYHISGMGLALISGASLLILVKHRTNMRRLLAGTENRVGVRRA